MITITVNDYLKRKDAIELKRLFALELSKIEALFKNNLGFCITCKEPKFDESMFAEVYPYAGNRFRKNEIVQIVKALGLLRLKCSHYASSFDTDTIALPESITIRFPRYTDNKITLNGELTAYGAFELCSMFLKNFDFHSFVDCFFKIPGFFVKSINGSFLDNKNIIKKKHLNSLMITKNKSFLRETNLTIEDTYLLEYCVIQKGIEFFLNFEKLIRNYTKTTTYCSFSCLLSADYHFDAIHDRVCALRNMIFHGYKFEEITTKNNIEYKLTFRFVCNVYKEIYQVCNRYKDTSMVYRQIADLIDIVFNAFVANKYLSTMETTEKIVNKRFYNKDKIEERLNRLERLLARIENDEYGSFDDYCEEAINTVKNKFNMTLSREKFVPRLKDDLNYNGQIKYYVFESEKIYCNNQELNRNRIVIIPNDPNIRYNFKKANGKDFIATHVEKKGLRTIVYLA